MKVEIERCEDGTITVKAGGRYIMGLTERQAMEAQDAITFAAHVAAEAARRAVRSALGIN